LGKSFSTRPMGANEMVAGVVGVFMDDWVEGRMRSEQGRHSVVGQDPVLGHQACRRRPETLEGRRIMAHALAQDQGKFHFLPVQQLSLGKRITDHLRTARANLL